MDISPFIVGPLQTNCYVLSHNNEAVIIDPGGNMDEIIAQLRSNGETVKYVLCTHLHVDHVYGNAQLQQEFGVTILASDKDGYLQDTELGRGGSWGLPQVEPFTFEKLEPGKMEILGGTCMVLETPGHTPGGLSFYFPDEKVLFSGDTLFYRSIGRTDFPRGNMDDLMNSILTRLYTLPDDVRVYPGHGRATDVMSEKNLNLYTKNTSV